MKDNNKEILTRLRSLRGYAMSLNSYDRFDLLVESINKLINHYSGKEKLAVVPTDSEEKHGN